MEMSRLSNASTGTNLASKFKTVCFFSTKPIENLAHVLSRALYSYTGITTTNIGIGRSLTVHDIQDNISKPDELMFILIPHLLVPSVSSLPPPGKYVIYQLEQLNDKGVGNLQPPVSFNALFCKLILQSVITFDYSNINLKYYPEELRHKLRVLVPPIDTVIPIKPNGISNIDVLFYGSMNSRRNIILGKLNQNLKMHGYNMTVVHSIFGNDLLKLISKTKVVLNVHFYENSIFENERVHSAIRFSKVRVVSERATEIDDEMDPLYASHPRIFFCDEIRNYNNCDLTIDVTDNLFKTCLTAIAAWEADQRDPTTSGADNAAINEKFKNALLSDI